MRVGFAHTVGTVSVLFLGVLPLLVGCGGGREHGTQLPNVEVVEEPERYDFTALRPPNMAYVLSVSDVFDVNFLFENRLSTRVTVRPDGAVSLPIVGEVPAVGRTPAELDSLLTEAYGTYFRDPELTVNVLSFADPTVYVLGEVGQPGAVKLTPGMSMLQALATRGGATPKANMGSVVLLRRVNESKAFAQRIDLHSTMLGHAMAYDLLLAPYDIIYVPPTFITRLNRFVDQFFHGLIPIPMLYLRTWEAFNVNDVYDVWARDRSLTLPN